MLLKYWQAWTSLKQGLQEQVWLAGGSIAEDEGNFLNFFFSVEQQIRTFDEDSNVILCLFRASMILVLITSKSLSLSLKRLFCTV